MRILLDTHIFLWLASDTQHLSRRHLEALEDTSNQLYLSAASLWEISIKREKGSLVMQGSALAAAEELGLSPLAINWRHAEFAATVHLPHRDPFDRMLLAQAIIEGLVLMTVDRVLLDSDGPILKG